MPPRDAPFAGPQDTLLHMLIRRELLIADLREAQRRHGTTFPLRAEIRRLTHLTLQPMENFCARSHD